MDGQRLNSGCTYREVIGGDQVGQSLANYLAARYTHTDFEAWCARITEGRVRLDGAAAHPGTTLVRGQVLTWARPPWVEPEAPLGCAVLFEDDTLVAVAKPSGLPTLPGGAFQDHTLLALVRRRHPEASPIHRLGRFTSGLVLFARTLQARDQLYGIFRDREVDKVYRALVSGVPATPAFAVEVPIGPVPHEGLGTIHAASATGRRAHSEVTVLARRGEDALVDVRITTGRPHQIRIHMAACGHPLVGDPLYGTGGQPVTAALPGDGGYLLHAHRLTFRHPVTGETLQLVCQPPEALRI